MININAFEASEVRALAVLAGMNYETLRLLIKGFAQKAKDNLVTAGDTVSIHRLQGRAGAFEDLLKAAEDAAAVVTRAKGA